MPRGLKAFSRRSQGLVQNMDRSQKPGVLYEGPESELETGKIVTVLVKI